ncbi:hypothetical protein [Spiroplasma endosymbiont of Virgichneumon dumeticola]|uniref:hypothetical protein n=1 Tax=Spiroplasma endosymbiont of Virgichneumon dumeticola TaxID=3139323 RepID=UPI0035C8A1FB
MLGEVRLIISQKRSCINWHIRITVTKKRLMVTKIITVSSYCNILKITCFL